MHTWLPLLTITIDIDPILAQIGPFALRWYGLMYVVGIVVGLAVAIPNARAHGIDEDRVWSCFWWALIAGLLGARLYFVVQSDFSAYLAQPARLLAFWEGGMAFFGAIFAATAALAIACRREKVPFWTLMDAAALFAVVGQGFGRIGNIINGDVVGYATDLPWGVIYAHPRSFVADHTVAYQPAAFYELIFNGILFAILWSLRSRLHRPGLLFVTYIILYSVGQILLFFLRDNEVLFWGLKQAQLTSFAVLAVAVPVWWWLKRREHQEARTEKARTKRAPR